MESQDHHGIKDMICKVHMEYMLTVQEEDLPNTGSKVFKTQIVVIMFLGALKQIQDLTILSEAVALN